MRHTKTETNNDNKPALISHRNKQNDLKENRLNLKIWRKSSEKQSNSVQNNAKLICLTTQFSLRGAMKNKVPRVIRRLIAITEHWSASHEHQLIIVIFAVENVILISLHNNNSNQMEQVRQRSGWFYNGSWRFDSEHMEIGMFLCVQRGKQFFGKYYCTGDSYW